MRGSWDSKAKGVDSNGSGAASAVDSKGTDSASGADSDAAVRSAEMAGEIAMGFRVLKIHGAAMENNRCRIYLESTPVV
jgi:hypothetical protein